MRPRYARTAWLCGALLLSAAATAHATTLLHMSLSKMAHTATAIVHARCVGNSTAWDAGEIWTFSSFDTKEVWSGSAPARFTVRLLGGRLGNLTSTVSGVPRFRAGEEVVLFLESTPRGDFTVLAWQEGTFRIGRDPRTSEASVTQDSASLPTFDPASHQFRVEGIRQMPLRDFRARIADSLRAGAGRDQ